MTRLSLATHKACLLPRTHIQLLERYSKPACFVKPSCYRVSINRALLYPHKTPRLLLFLQWLSLYLSLVMSFLPSV